MLSLFLFESPLLKKLLLEGLRGLVQNLFWLLTVIDIIGLLLFLFSLSVDREINNPNKARSQPWKEKNNESSL